MIEELHKKKCVPCEGGVEPLDMGSIDKYLKKIDGWKMKQGYADNKPVNTIQKRYKFKNFRDAMSFLREVEEIAESEGHHPDFCVHYNKVDFTIWTHAIGGLHENDFILASKIEQIEKS